MAGLSQLGIQTYGFTPMNLPRDFDFWQTIHSANEAGLWVGYGVKKVADHAGICEEKVQELVDEAVSDPYDYLRNLGLMVSQCLTTLIKRVWRMSYQEVKG
jgi:hypothetical protein